MRYRGRPLHGKGAPKTDTLPGGCRRPRQQVRALEQAAFVIDGKDAPWVDGRRAADVWRSGSTAMKSQMARLRAKGQRLRDGDYFRLLKVASRGERQEGDHITQYDRTRPVPPRVTAPE